MNLAKLAEPFYPSDIEWRAQSCGMKKDGNPWVQVLAYVTNRAIQQRLDDVCQPHNWKNEYHKAPNGEGTLCGISINVGGEWITKFDGAENSAIHALKGGLSNSMKRAAVQWGIGRYLYNLETQWAKCHLVNGKYDAHNNHAEDKKTKSHINWLDPSLPEWAMPLTDMSVYLENISTSTDKEQLKKACRNASNVIKTHNTDMTLKNIVDLYNTKNDEFDELVQSEISESNANTHEWLETTIDALSLIPNDSALNSVATLHKKTLSDHCKKFQLNIHDFLPKLNEAIAKRQKELGA